MAYISETKADEYIFTIIELFKQNKYEEVINLIKEKNIDPQHSSEIISDYAAIWMEDRYLIHFFEKIKEIGGNPLGHDSILKNIAQYGKIESLKYLIKEGALTAPRIKDYLVYVINTSIMGGEVESFKLLYEHLDVTQYKLPDENNPSFINRAVANPSSKMLDYLFEQNLIQPYIFTDEVITSLKSLNKNVNEQNLVIKKILENFGLENKENYISETEYEHGDFEIIFKKIEYDMLNMNLAEKNINTKKSLKI